MTQEWTPTANTKLTEYLARPGYEIPVGLGTAENACSIAAINLALTGELIDTIPYCMSGVIGMWMIRVQDKMPAVVRNSREWRELLPLAASTGRQWDKERERMDVVIGRMWEYFIAYTGHR